MLCELNVIKAHEEAKQKKETKSGRRILNFNLEARNLSSSSDDGSEHYK